MDYRIQRLKQDLTNAQQRNKKQRIQLNNYKKCHERDLETIKKQKEVIDKAIKYILECSINEKGHINVSLSSDEVGKLLDILEECYND